MEDKTFKLTVQYDGSLYHGWQRQPGYPTIQGEIERILELVARHPVHVEGSGRTDAGVHALAQTASFSLRTRLSGEDFQRALNGLLPSDIVISDCVRMEHGFHARFDAVGKTYQYRILNRPVSDAFKGRYAWFIKRDLDLACMQEASAHLVGEHDFKSFEGVGSPRKHTVRRVSRLTVTRDDQGHVIVEITANGFLQYMVRNIVGTLVDVGSLRKTADQVRTILAAKDRRCAGPTAPPNGLFLKEVCYRAV